MSVPVSKDALDVVYSALRASQDPRIDDVTNEMEGEIVLTVRGKRPSRKYGFVITADDITELGELE